MSKRKKISIITILIIIALCYYKFEDQSNLLRVCFLDVGQGDAVLIKSPQGKNILIDGGPDANLIHQLGNKHSYQNHQIDILVLTHAHADHFYGLVEIVKRYDIKLVLWSGVESQWSEYQYFQNIADKLDTKVALLGQEYLIEDDLKIRVVYPTHILKEEEAEDINNTSVSLILSYGEIDFWLAGDLTCEGEEEIIRQGLNTETEIYKASHHGSRWSNCDDILDKLKPELAIIQSGLDNQHKHPHLETLERLEERSIKILSNDELGDIWIESDGEKYWVKKELE